MDPAVEADLSASSPPCCAVPADLGPDQQSARPAAPAPHPGSAQKPQDPVGPVDPRVLADWLNPVGVRRVYSTSCVNRPRSLTGKH